MSLVLFRKAGEDVAPVALNLFKNTLSLPLAVITLLAVGGPILAGGGWAVGLMAVSALLGMALGDSMLLSSLNRLGAGWSTIVNAAYSPVMVVVTSWLFGIPLTWGVGVGVGLVTVAVWMSGDPKEAFHADHKQRGTLWAGLGIGLASQVLMALGSAILKYPMWGHPAVVETESAFAITAWRLLFGTLMMAAWISARKDRAVQFASLKPSKAWRVMIPGTILGTYLSLIAWFMGLQHIGDSLVKAGVLGQSGLILLPFMGWLWLRERLSTRKIAAAALALVGSIVVVVT